MKRVTIPKSIVDVFIRVWNEENYSNPRDHLTEDYLNCGWCYQLAVVIKKIYGNKAKFYTDYDGGHCWVKIGDYHYDSNNLRGSKESLSMSYSDNTSDGAVPLRTIIKTWRGANSGPVQLKTIDKVVKEWKRLHAKG